MNDQRRLRRTTALVGLHIIVLLIIIGTVFADSDESEKPHPPTATATLTVEPTATPDPTSTPDPTATDVPTDTPEPTSTPTLEATHELTPSYTPTVTALPTETATPTQTATATVTQTVPPEATRTSTPRPTTKPDPTATQQVVSFVSVRWSDAKQPNLPLQTGTLRLHNKTTGELVWTHQIQAGESMLECTTVTVSSNVIVYATWNDEPLHLAGTQNDTVQLRVGECVLIEIG